MDFKDKKIAILGFGVEGKDVHSFLKDKNAQITICDQKLKEELDLEDADEADFQCGPTYLDDLEKFDIIFRSPGIPIHHESLIKAKNTGKIITSATKLFFELSPAKIIGVTGTKGKGTTTTLISEILKWKSQIPNPNFQKNTPNTQYSSQVWIGGNIGEQLLSKLDQIKPTDWIIFELSSFQLHDMDRSPHISVVLNITSDHMDYHKDRQEYVEAKKNIVANQGPEDFAVINADYLTSFEFSAATPAKIYYFSRRKWIDRGAYITAEKKEKREVILNTGEEEIVLCKTSELQLRGEHNLENICAAVTAAYLARASLKTIADAIKEFKGLEHRLELVAEKNGVKYYNDSFATGPQPTIAAINSFDEPIILILGGRDKNLDFTELAELINRSNHIKAVILIGELADKLENIITETQSDRGIQLVRGDKTMQKIVSQAKELAEPGDVVLLSPAAASFDMFASYKDRGKLFKNSVNNIEG